VDLVSAMLDTLTDAPARERPEGRTGVRTRQTLLAILGAAEQHGARAAVLREARDAMLARGDYAGAVEELTPINGDPVAAVPVFAALAAVLIRPSLWQKFHTGAVGPYAVTPTAWAEIRAGAE
jgi:hypothetical protein